MKIEKWIQQWERAKSGRSENYQRLVRTVANRLRGFCTQRQVADIEQITPDLLWEMHDTWQQEVSPRTLDRYLCLVKGAVAFAISRDLLPEVLLRDFPETSVPGRTPVVLSRQQEQQLTEALRARNHPLWPIVACALNTGMRRTELCGLLARHLQEGRITVTGELAKNNRPRVIPINTALAPIIEPLVAGASPTDHLFQPAFSDRMNPPWVTRQFSKFVRGLGLPEEITFHVLRHTCATRLAEAGMSAWSLREVLGHSDIRTTQIYVHMATSEANMDLLCEIPTEETKER